MKKKILSLFLVAVLLLCLAPLAFLEPAQAATASSVSDARDKIAQAQQKQKELQQKLARMGLDVDESHFYTSALATARFLSNQAPGCSAFVIGAPGLMNALYDVGITMNDVNPDYVVMGEGKVGLAIGDISVKDREIDIRDIVKLKKLIAGIE